MGRGGNVVSAGGGGFAKEEDGKSWLVTFGSRGSMVPASGGDFGEEEDGESCLGTMVFNFRRMTSSLESMEAWAATSLAMTASRRSRLEAEGSTSAIEEQQKRTPNRNVLALVTSTTTKYRFNIARLTSVF
ncbi:hypothetical protein GmHk_20G057705 [Glycine max]|nr:hypothetical protein GmHk_20G057705 [Glycine max]